MKTNGEFLLSLIATALAQGASQAEVYQKTSKSLSVEAKDGSVEAVETSVVAGYSVRVICRNRLGFSYFRLPEQSENAVKSAIESSNWTEEDRYLDLPGPGTPESPEIYDPEIANINEKDAIEKALLIERACLEDGRVKRLRKAASSFASSETLIYNSKGMAASYRSTSCAAHVTAVAEDGGDSQMGWDFQAGRFLRDISFEEVGRTAADRAIRLLGARKINAVKAPVLLEPSVSVEFLGIFASLLSSDAVQKGKSLLKGRLGENVISKNVSIIDDGLLPGKSGTKPVDGEGVPTFRKSLIEEGVLKRFMYNTYTAKKDGVSSTGNAVRGSFSSVPSVSHTNLYLSPKNAVSDLISAMGAGLLVTDAMGVHMANPISGEFSIGVSGMWVEGGQSKFPVKEAVISGNILEFFKNVLFAGADLIFYGNMGSPGLVIGPVDISA